MEKWYSTEIREYLNHDTYAPAIAGPKDEVMKAPELCVFVHATIATVTALRRAILNSSTALSVRRRRRSRFDDVHQVEKIAAQIRGVPSMTIGVSKLEITPSSHGFEHGLSAELNSVRSACTQHICAVTY